MIIALFGGGFLSVDNTLYGSKMKILEVIKGFDFGGGAKSAKNRKKDGSMAIK